jgi:quercetin dioxygenase-like cupin family protein
MTPGDQAADLGAFLPLAGDGVHWTLSGSADLNANLAHLDAGHEVGEHVNDDVDVLVVVVEGDGELWVDDQRHDLRPTVVAHLPKGARRTIRAGDAGDAGLTYLTVHRRRDGLAIGPTRR